MTFKINVTLFLNISNEQLLKNCLAYNLNLNHRKILYSTMRKIVLKNIFIRVCVVLFFYNFAHYFLRKLDVPNSILINNELIC